MAPEQAAGNNTAVKQCTDVYGIGAVLYQLLTVIRPLLVEQRTRRSVLLNTEPRQPRLLNPKIDRDLSTICLKCLERIQSVGTVLLSHWPKIWERWLKQ